MSLSFADTYRANITDAAPAILGNKERKDRQTYNSKITVQQVIMKLYFAIAVSILILASSCLQAQNIHWDSTFTHGNNVDGPVYSIATHDSNVYFGGHFSKVGLTNVSNIVKWDGKNWQSLGPDSLPGVNGIVRSIIVDSVGRVFVGGKFSQAGDTAASNIAFWDGAHWHPLNGGVNDTVYAMAMDSGKLYAAGSFTIADGRKALRFAEWTKKGWSTKKEITPNNTIRALYVENGNVLYGGFFDSVGVDGTTKFLTSNTGGIESFNGPVFSIISHRLFLAVGGAFSKSDGGTSNYKNIESLPEIYYYPSYLRQDQLNATVYSLCQINSKYFVAGGAFDSVNNFPAQHLILWNGVEWEDTYSKIKDTVFALAKMQNRIYIGTGITHTLQPIMSFVWSDSVNVHISQGQSAPLSGGEISFSVFNDSNSNSALAFRGGFYNYLPRCGSIYPLSTFALQSLSPADRTQVNGNILGGDGCHSWTVSSFILDNGTTVNSEPSFSFSPTAQGVVNSNHGHSASTAFPNPFSSELNIRFATPKAGNARVDIYDALGVVVQTVFDGPLIEGEHVISWASPSIPEGIYFFRIVGPDYNYIGEILRKF